MIEIYMYSIIVTIRLEKRTSKDFWSQTPRHTRFSREIALTDVVARFRMADAPNWILNTNTKLLEGSFPREFPTLGSTPCRRVSHTVVLKAAT